MSSKQPRSLGSALYDRNLVPRLASYAQNHELDLDDCVQYLRHNYKEYQRQKVGPFTKQVLRALDAISRRGEAETAELRLQVRPAP